MKFKSFWIVIMLSVYSGIVLPANPVDANVVHGHVDFSNPTDNTLLIHNSPNAIINWQQFNIHQGELVRFIQESIDSAVLNRVIGENPSAILGSLSSNGRVFLINPNGVVFGEHAVVDTAGLLVSTLNLDDDDFIAQAYDFSADENVEGILNHGLIVTSGDGNIVLIAPQIENHGVIKVEQGELILAAGEKVKLIDFSQEGIQFEVQAPHHQVLNLGQLIAEGGSAALLAGSIQHHGSIEANGIGRDAAGNIVLTAQDDIEITDNAYISASGLSGGHIRVQSEQGDSVVRGHIEALGSDGSGGTVQVLGDRVGVFANAEIDASGTHAGGEILLGGDYQGQGDLQTARQTQLDSGVQVHADALQDGDGGTVIVWADGYTQALGTVTARGGNQGGDGGFVEISGKESMLFDGQVETGAVNGDAGTVLFDPGDINIGSGGVTYDGATDDQFTESANLLVNFSNTSVESIWATQNVIFQANNNITIGGTSLNGSGGFDLTLQAGNTINIYDTQTGITTNGGDFIAIANSTLADGVVNAERQSGAASILIGDGVQSANIDTTGGNVFFEIRDGAGLTNNQAGNITINNLASVMTGSTSGDIVFKADNGISMVTGANIFAGGEIFIEPFTPGTTMSVNSVSGTLQLTDTILDFMSTSQLTLGSNSTGDIFLNGDLGVTPYNNLSILSDNDIVMENLGGGLFLLATFGAGDNLLLRSQNGNIRFQNVGDILAVNGPANIVLDSVNGELQNLGHIMALSPGGDITLVANGNIDLFSDINPGTGGNSTLHSINGQIIQTSGAIMGTNVSIMSALGANLSTQALNLSFDNSGDGFFGIQNNSGGAGLNLLTSVNSATGFSTAIQETNGALNINATLNFNASVPAQLSASGDINISAGASITGTGGGGLIMDSGVSSTFTNAGTLSDNGGVQINANAGGMFVNAPTGIINNAGAAGFDIVIEADDFDLQTGSTIDAGGLSKTILKSASAGVLSLGGATAISGTELDTISNFIVFDHRQGAGNGIDIVGQLDISNGQMLRLETQGAVSFNQGAGIGLNATGSVEIIADQIVDTSAGIDVISSQLYADTINGLGSTANAIDTQTGTLYALNIGSGDMNIDNSGGNLFIIPLGIQNLSTNPADDLTITNSGGDITVDGLIFTQAGSIDVSTLSPASDIIINTDIFSATDVSLISTQDIILNGTSIGGPGTIVEAMAGNMVLSAGRDFHLHGGTLQDEMAIVDAFGNLDLSVGNDLEINGGSASNTGAAIKADSIATLSPIGNDVILTSGSGDQAFAGIKAHNLINLDVLGNLSINGGSGLDTGASISNFDPGDNLVINLNVTGNVNLNGGTGVSAGGGIISDNTSLNITIDANDINLTASNATDSGAAIAAINPGNNADITLNARGSVTLQASANNYVLIGSQDAGGTVSITSGFGGNEGDINLNDGILSTTGIANLTANGGVSNNGDIRLSGGIVNIAALTATVDGEFYMNGGTLDVVGNTTMNGAFSLVSGTHTVTGTQSYSSTYTQSGGVTSLVGGSITSVGNFNIAGGRLVGVGTITTPLLDNSGGRIAPGSDLGADPGVAITMGTLTVNGDYSMGDIATISLDLAGSNFSGGDPGFDYDWIAISGNASFAGDLELVVDELSPTPYLDDVYNFLTYGSSQGAFNNVISVPSEYQFSVTPGASALEVILQGAPGQDPIEHIPDDELETLLEDFEESVEDVHWEGEEKELEELEEMEDSEDEENNKRKKVMVCS